MELPAYYTVKYRHERNVIPTQRRVLHERVTELNPRTNEARVVTTIEETLKLNPKGGSTTANIYDASGTLVASGTAYCNPSDHFVKSVGRVKALGRAVSEWRRMYGG